MKITADTLRGKKIGFWGLGRSNLALINALPLDGAEIILRSDVKIRREELSAKLRDCKIFDGDAVTREISEDILFLSPSVRRDRREILKAMTRGTKISSDAELFFENNTKPIYAVTGSDGKSTTATLISLLLGEKCALVGNIGTPMYQALTRKANAYVCELSSFMLSAATPKVKRASVTNITPNHLDFHNSLEEYTRIKLSLLDAAEEKIVNFDDEALQGYASGKKVFGITSTKYGQSELKSLCSADIFLTFEDGVILMNGEEILTFSQICRKEAHNIKNLMTAIAMTHGKVERDKIRQIAGSFNGLAHRCELVCRRSGVDFYNSSIDSTPTRTARTLESLGRKAVIILGGRGKGVSYELLRAPLAEFCHKAVIYGEDAEKIFSAIHTACPTVTVDGFDEAVEFAKELGGECGTVLLSPAATSYDEFKNYEERGKRFCDLIKSTK